MTRRARWPLPLATVLVGTLAATWWWASSDDVVASAPISPVASVQAPVVAPAPTPVIAPIPIPAAAKPVDAAPLSASAFRLVGTVVAANAADSFALVRRAADSPPMRVHTGDRVEGLTVSAIESDRVVLAGAAHAIVIEADRTAAAPASPVPSRAVSPAPASQEEPAWAGDPAPFGH